MSEAGRPYVVVLRRVATGQMVAVRGFRTTDSDWAVWDEFLWVEGNFSCDCNRGQFFARAGGDVKGDPDCCGDERFIALKAILDDGTEIPLDEPLV